MTELNYDINYINLYYIMFNYTVEFLGTMALILVILITGGNPVIIGAALAGLVAVAGSLSGAHFNPAVSIMALVKGDLSQSDLMGYILAQILGALFALEIFKRFL